MSYVCAQAGHNEDISAAVERAFEEARKGDVRPLGEVRVRVTCSLGHVNFFTEPVE